MHDLDMGFLAYGYEEADPTVPVARRVARAWAAEKHFAALADRAKKEKNALLPAWRDALLEQGITDAVRVHAYEGVGVSARPTTKHRASPRAEAVQTGEYARVMREHGLGDLVQETTHAARLAAWYSEAVQEGVVIPEPVLRVISTHSEQTMSLRKVALQEPAPDAPEPEAQEQDAPAS